ncbi:MAG: TraC family protein [Patescibacteria group bacterium]
MASQAQSQSFVPIKEIRNGTVILDDGSFNTILLVTSMNFALKSYDEQRAVMGQFQNFLNSIEFPIQISIQSRHLDIRPYLASLEEKRRDEQNDLIKMQISEYSQFIQNFTDSVNIMEKRFFIVVSYTPAILNQGGPKSFVETLLGKGSSNKMLSDEEFEETKSQLEQRTDLVIGGISRTGLKAVRLGTEEAIEVLYRIFNPGESEKPVQLN